MSKQQGAPEMTQATPLEKMEVKLLERALNYSLTCFLQTGWQSIHYLLYDFPSSTGVL
jgi:hypothetical protein